MKSFMKSVAGTVLVLYAFLMPALASAAWSFSIGSNGGSFSYGSSYCTSNICAVAGNIIYIINGILVPVIFAVAFLVFLYGVASAYILSNGDPERVKSGHTLILWGIIGFVVMVSLWGLVNVVSNTFGLGGSYAPPTPTSY